MSAPASGGHAHLPAQPAGQPVYDAEHGVVHPPQPGAPEVPAFELPPHWSQQPAPQQAEVAPYERNMMSTIIVLVVLAIGAWSALNYMGKMADVLSDIDSTNIKITAEMKQAGVGLQHLDTKTSRVKDMDKSAGELVDLMGGMDKNMGGMLDGVKAIGGQMTTLSGSLNTLDGEVTKVSDANQSIATKLTGIQGDLRMQAATIATMRNDVEATSTELTRMPNMVRATNERLSHVNSVVCYMGQRGIQNHIKLYISFLGIPNGNAEIDATLVPTGAWNC
jgi:hypothetical protein